MLWVNSAHFYISASRGGGAGDGGGDYPVGDYAAAYILLRPESAYNYGVASGAGHLQPHGAQIIL